jgi:hypothetical protein
MLFLNKNYISHAYLYHYFDIVYTTCIFYKLLLKKVWIKDF